MVLWGTNYTRFFAEVQLMRTISRCKLVVYVQNSIFVVLTHNAAVHLSRCGFTLSHCWIVFPFQ